MDSLVESGAYATATDVVDAGLKVLQAQDTHVEHWLRGAVAPAYGAMLAAPSHAISMDDAFADIRARHEKRLTTAS